MDPLAEAECSLTRQASGGCSGLSRFLHTVATTDGRVIAYSNVTFDPVVMPELEWRNLVDRGEISDSTYGRLAKARLLGAAEDDARLIATARRRLQLAIEATQVMYAIASDGCNMACSYCPIPVRVNLDRLMPVEVFESAFRELVHTGAAVTQRFILLYGGEPLENLPLLKHIAERYTDLADVDSALLEILVCSNLTGLNDRVIALLQRAPFKVVVGIDAATGHGRVLPDRSSTHLQTFEAAKRGAGAG